MGEKPRLLERICTHEEVRKALADRDKQIADLKREAKKAKDGQIAQLGEELAARVRADEGRDALRLGGVAARSVLRGGHVPGDEGLVEVGFRLRGCDAALDAGGVGVHERLGVEQAVRGDALGIESEVEGEARGAGVAMPDGVHHVGHLERADLRGGGLGLGLVEVRVDAVELLDGRRGLLGGAGGRGSGDPF